MLVINPWKLGFLLIVLANIFFHTPASFLLFLILFLIFLYAYSFLGFLFNDFAKEYALSVSGGYNPIFEASLLEMKSSEGVLILLSRCSELTRNLLEVWTMRGLTYSCVVMPDNKNYFLSLLSETYSLSADGVFRGFFLLDSTNFQQKEAFCRGVVSDALLNRSV